MHINYVSTEEDNAVKLKMFSSGKLYHQYNKVTLSVWLRIFSTDEDVQYVVKSNLGTAESHYQYNCRYAAWYELLEKRDTTDFSLTSINNQKFKEARNQTVLWQSFICIGSI